MSTDALFAEDVEARPLLVTLYRSFAVVAGAFLVYNLIASVALVAAGVESLEALRDQPVVYTLVSGAASTAFLVAPLAYLALRDDWDVLHRRRPDPRDAGFVVLGVLAVAATAFGASLVVSVIATVLESVFGVAVEFGQNTVITTGRRNPSMFLLMIPVTLLIVGPGEELVFRGVVQGLLRRVVGVVPAIVVASALFGLGHYFAVGTGNAWTYLVSAGLMGLALGAVYEYSGSFAVPALVHGLWNSAVFAFNYLAAVGELSLPV